MVVTALNIFDIYLGKFKIEEVEVTSCAERRFNFALVGKQSFMQSLVKKSFKQVMKEQRQHD